MKKLLILLCALVLLGGRTGSGLETPLSARDSSLVPDLSAASDAPASGGEADESEESADAEEAERELYISGDYEYAILEDGTAEITTYYGEAEALIIPETLDGLPVTTIGDWAFEGCSSLSAVTIPDSVTTIGDGAFAYCSSLSDVTIPDSVTSIGDGAFASCSSLSSIEVSPDHPALAVIDGVLFSKGDRRLICYPGGLSESSYEIPQGIVIIGEEAFAGSDKLSAVTIPGSVTTIGDWAFEGCSSLSSVTIPDSVASIGSGAFYRCDSLSSVTIPDSVTSIGYSAFAYCSSLSAVTIPNSVTTIGDWAFEGCSSLSSVTIPDSVTEIGYGAFEDCDSLKTVIVGRDSYALTYCRENGLPYTYPDANDWLNG